MGSSAKIVFGAHLTEALLFFYDWMAENSRVHSKNIPPIGGIFLLLIIELHLCNGAWKEQCHC